MLRRFRLNRFLSSYPAHELMGLPALSPTMEKGNVVSWLKAEGDEITAGDLIAEIETDKAVMELEAMEDGFLAKIIVPGGTNDVKVGDAIAVTVEDSALVAAFRDYSPDLTKAYAASPDETAKKSADSASSAPATSAPKAGAKAASGKSLPDGFIFLGLPALSPTMDTGNLVSWLKQEGDAISPGDLIAEIETDKAVMEFEAQEDAILAKILVPGDTQNVRAGSPIAIVSEDPDIDIKLVADWTLADVPSQTDGAAEEAKPAKEAAPVAPKAAAAPAATPSKQAVPSGSRQPASPFARKMLREAGLTPEQFGPGSGPKSRISSRDLKGKDLSQVQTSSSSASSSASSTPLAVGSAESGMTFDVLPNSNVRKITAQRLTESKQTVPHYYLTMEMTVDNILALRKKLKAKSGTAPSVNDFVIKAAASALRKVPDMNSSWTPEAIHQYHQVDIAFAVATDRGLLTPIVTDADVRSVGQIADVTRDMAGRARDGKLKPAEFMGGSFTISNLGMFGIKQFTAVINPPQAGILAVGGVEQRVVVGANGSFETQSIMTVTLSCDHRVVDGAVGAQWLQHFKSVMEDPLLLVI